MKVMTRVRLVVYVSVVIVVVIVSILAEVSRG